MLLEDIWQDPLICVVAFANDPKQPRKALAEVGKFNTLGQATMAARNYALDVFKHQTLNARGAARVASNGIQSTRDEGQDARLARTLQFERTGRLWVADIGMIRFIAKQGGIPSLDDAYELAQAA